jgi:hypothetical protein
MSDNDIYISAGFTGLGLPVREIRSGWRKPVRFYASIWKSEDVGAVDGTAQLSNSSSHRLRSIPPP